MRAIHRVLVPAGLAAILTLGGCGGGTQLSPANSAASSASHARAAAPQLNPATLPYGAVGGRTIPELRSVSPRAPGWMSPQAKSGALLYLASLGTNEIGIYKQKGANQSPMSTITDGLNFPCCMTVDIKGNLYVTNEGANNVSVYPPGATSPSTVYTTDLSTATDVAVWKDGTIYIPSFNGLANGWVSVYPKGDTSKEYRLSDFGGGAPLCVALDDSGNLFVMYDLDGSGDSAVNEYAPGAKTGTNLNLNFKWGAGIQVDKAGDLLVVQQVEPSEILVFPPGATQPSQTILDPNGDQPFSIALDKKSNLLFAADLNQNTVDSFKYPVGTEQYTIAGGFDNPSGIAVNPPQPRR